MLVGAHLHSELPSDAPCFDEVVREFRRTALATDYEVVSVAVIHDTGKFKKYLGTKEDFRLRPSLSRSHTALGINERWLWHGVKRRHTRRTVLLRRALRRPGKV